MKINIDIKVYPDNIIDFEFFKFPAGEVQTKYNKFPRGFPECGGKIVNLYARIFTSDDVIALLQVVSILERERIQIINLTIPYLPFSRMDRNIENHSFSLKVFSKLLNLIDVTKIITIDAHSSSSELLINKLVSIYPFGFHNRFIFGIKNLNTLIIPDLGASKRYPEILKIFKTVQATKERSSDGESLTVKIHSESDLGGQDCIIIDDICDGGKTFVELAKALKDKNSGKLYLFITHGIFSNGLDELSKYFELIGCTDSFNNEENQKNWPNLLRVLK